MKNKKVRALVLLSGGLDSILAVRLLLEQRIEVETVNFRTNFCGPGKARPAAKVLGVPLREVSIREEFIPVLKNPKHGYGSGLNPCIDCHGLMLKKAARIMKEEGFDFIATGEVLGERPMSQHKQALGIVERESGLEGYLLRPLSAKVLEPTIPEKEGLVDREKLEGISGRTRRRQLELAEQFDIKEYPSPGGGCALTESGFVERLKVLMKNKPDFTPADVDLVRFGRHFWLNGIQIILGRDAQENELLKSLGQGNILLEMENFPGPVALVRDAKQDDPVIEEAKKLLVKFSKAKDKDFSEVKFRFL